MSSRLICGLLECSFTSCSRDGTRLIARMRRAIRSAKEARKEPETKTFTANTQAVLGFLPVRDVRQINKERALRIFRKYYCCTRLWVSCCSGPTFLERIIFCSACFGHSISSHSHFSSVCQSVSPSQSSGHSLPELTSYFGHLPSSFLPLQMFCPR